MKGSVIDMLSHAEKEIERSFGGRGLFPCVEKKQVVH